MNALPVITLQDTPHHLDLVGALVDIVSNDGAAVALDSLREARPALHNGVYNDTVAVFLVWSVERLVAAGLSRRSVLWHPLVHVDSPLAWWSADVLDSAAAADHFVAPIGLASGEPMPCEPARTLAAA